MVTKMAAPYRELLHVMLYYYPLEGANVKIGCHLLFFGPKILARPPKILAGGGLPPPPHALTE